MSQPELLARVCTALTQAGFEYMVTGSIVSSLQGEPRATHDIDIVIKLSAASVPRLLRTFREPEYYVDATAVREALANDGMFNVIDTQEGEKVDFWVLTSGSFDVARFGRRATESVAGQPLTVSQPEDTILMKLRWAKLSGGSEKQFRDALRIYEVQFCALDLDYLRRWVPQLDIEELWRRLEEEARPPEGP